MRDPDYLMQQRKELLSKPIEFRLHRRRAARAGHVLLGNRVEQRPAMGLVRRSVLARANAGDYFHAWPVGCLYSARNANQISGRQFSAAARTQFRRRFNHHLLCLRHFVRVQHVVAGLAAIAIRLRRLSFGLGAVAGGDIFDRRVDYRGAAVGEGDRCAMVHRDGFDHRGGRELLDVDHEFRNQPLAGDLAARGAGVRTGLIFRAAERGAYLYIPRELRGAAVGLFSLLRNEGGSVGTSIAQTIQERREQFHLERLGEHLDPFNPRLEHGDAQLQANFTRVNGDPVKSKEMAWQVLSNLREKQASSLAYFDVFWVGTVVAICLVALVFLMSASWPRKVPHVGGE